MRHFLDRANGVPKDEILFDGAIFDHLQDERGDAVAQVDRVLAHVGIAHDDVEASVLLPVGVRFVPGIDDRAFDHRIERNLGFEEV